MAYIPKQNISIMLAHCKTVKIMKPIKCNDKFFVVAKKSSAPELIDWMASNRGDKTIRKYLNGGSIFIYSERLGDSYFVVEF